MGVNLLIVNVNVVTTIRCPFCKCDPCDCDWGANENFKNRNFIVSQPVDEETLSDSDLSPGQELELPIFDSIYNSLGTRGEDTHKRRYKGTIADLSMFKVGDLVNWHPFWGLCDWDKPWIVKRVFPQDPLQCSYYDYEITDGQTSHLVTFAEIRKMEEK